MPFVSQLIVNVAVGRIGQFVYSISSLAPSFSSEAGPNTQFPFHPFFPLGPCSQLTFSSAGTTFCRQMPKECSRKDGETKIGTEDLSKIQLNERQMTFIQIPFPFSSPPLMDGGRKHMETLGIGQIDLRNSKQNHFELQFFNLIVIFIGKVEVIKSASN